MSIAGRWSVVNSGSRHHHEPYKYQRKQPEIRIKQCELCGSTENLDYYAGGPFLCVCKKCKEIITKYEEGKKRQQGRGV